MKPAHTFLPTSLFLTALLTGCGGGASVTQPTSSGRVHFTGSTTVSTTSTSPVTVPASGGSVVSTGDAGTGGTAVIPSGAVSGNTTLPLGTQLAIIPMGSGFAGSFSPGSALRVNGVSDSGVGVSDSGFTTVNTALPVTDGTNGTPDGTSYTLVYPNGTINTTPKSGTALHKFSLTIQNIVFTGKFYIRTNPLRVISPTAINITGRLPNNGQNAAGSVVTAFFGPGNNGRSATLTVDYGNGFSLYQTKTITNNLAGFNNLQQDSSNVPGTGVQTVSFAIGDLP